MIQMAVVDSAASVPDFHCRPIGGGKLTPRPVADQQWREE